VDAVEEREERVHLGGVVVPARAFGGGGDLVPEATQGDFEQVAVRARLAKEVGRAL
jgi:hypothetical protein